MTIQMTHVPQTGPEREAYLRALAPPWAGRMPTTAELPHGGEGRESILSGVKTCLYNFCAKERREERARRATLRAVARAGRAAMRVGRDLDRIEATIRNFEFQLEQSHLKRSNLLALQDVEITIK